MCEFPLYDTLMSEIKDRDLTVTQKTELIKKIENIDKDGSELVYALIKCYYVKNENRITSNNPYNSTIKENNITYDLASFPHKLRQILYKFIQKHTKKLKEDKQMSKVREKTEKKTI